ncbi:hypothetical protein NDU88_001113 [Pleurodeles waltl]|uniref:Uncharacterized protein n=1 Tax=Pleurodeles waltl TaxID=8319 RepID=A0AAV7LAJ0_PLEWA|nr:hypothetical protein NDU88_001113 [Pleurodeles waltl]
MVMYAGGDGQHRSEKGYMACHHQGRVDPGGLRLAEHELSEMVGRPDAGHGRRQRPSLGWPPNEKGVPVEP